MKNTAVPVCLIIGSAEICFVTYIFVLLIFQSAFIMGFLYFMTFICGLIAVALYQFVIPPVTDGEAKNILSNKDNPSKILVFAHRGAGHDAPENTLAAFREAHKNGADGVEFDLAFTKDNIAVLLHDDEVDRTTNGTGKLEEMMFDEIRQLDASAKHPFSSRFRGEKIPTFDEGIEECLKLGLKIIIDVKSYDSKAVTVIFDMFQKYPQLYKVAIVCSFYPNLIYQLRQVDPKIVTGVTWRPRFLSYDQIINGRPKYNSVTMMALARVGDEILDWVFHRWAWYVTGASAVLVHKDCLSHEYVRMWRSRGVHILAWTVNHPVEKEYLSKELEVSYISDTVRRLDAAA